MRVLFRLKFQKFFPPIFEISHHSPSSHADAREVMARTPGDSRRTGKPWSLEEHNAFLRGLNAYGKGRWKEISKFYVPSRTCTQIASHAQKYFERADPLKTRKRRPHVKSLFDVRLMEEKTDETTPPVPAPEPEPVAQTTISQGGMISPIQFNMFVYYYYLMRQSMCYNVVTPHARYPLYC